MGCWYSKRLHDFRLYFGLEDIYEKKREKIQSDPVNILL